MKSKVIPIIVGLALVLAACARSEGASRRSSIVNSSFNASGQDRDT